MNSKTKRLGRRKPSAHTKGIKNDERNNGKAWKKGLAPNKR